MAKSKSSSKSIQPSRVSYTTTDKKNVNVRKIANGFIVSESWYKKKRGGGEEYFENEVFSKTNPVTIKTGGSNFTGKK